MLTRYEFEVLRYLEEEGSRPLPVRALADALCISGSTVLGCLESLKESGLIAADGDALGVTEAGQDALEPFRVRRAVILAAGFGSRLMPATADRPKPMVPVNGKRIIDTLLDALVSAGIREITVVGGYRFEKLKALEERYPFIRLIENREYADTNNISSAVLASGSLHGGCYLCEADLLIRNPRIIRKYQAASNILGSYSMETDDWCFRMADGYLTDYRKGNTYCYTYYGISYWTPEDCEKLRTDFREVYQDPNGGKDFFWEFVPFVLRKERYRVEVRPCSRQDIMEIDSYDELMQLDPHFQAERETER